MSLRGGHCVWKRVIDMPMDPSESVDRAAMAADLERARVSLHELLDGMGAKDFERSSNGTRWTNEQLLFHMVFGCMVVRRLLVLVRMFARLPDGVSRVSAGRCGLPGRVAGDLVR